MLCQECRKKDTCIELCERVKNWVDQDYVSQRELVEPEWLLEWLNIKAMPSYKWQEIISYFTDERVNFPFLTSIQNKILHLFYFEGLSYRKIARAMSGTPAKRKINHYEVKSQIYLAKRQILNFSSIYRREYKKDGI